MNSNHTPKIKIPAKKSKHCSDQSRNGNLEIVINPRSNRKQPIINY